MVGGSIALEATQAAIPIPRIAATNSKIREDCCVEKRRNLFLMWEIEKTIPKAKTGAVTYTVMGMKKCNTW